MLDLFINTYVKVFFPLTPFFVISAFLSMITGMTSRQRRRIALRTIAAVIEFSLVLYLFANHIAAVMGITLDAFRIGARAMLFLPAVALVVVRTEPRIMSVLTKMTGLVLASLAAELAFAGVRHFLGS